MNETGSIVHAVRAEADRAVQIYGSWFTSTHEGYGVLAEEVAELLDAIRTNDADAIFTEAIQVSAVAMRLADSVRHGTGCRQRSGITQRGEAK